MNDLAITANGISKSFKLPHERHTGLKQAVLSFRPGKKYEMQHVLEDITFEIKKGEFFGIVGRNGSGKSTLLKLLAQIYTPEKGAIIVNGTLTPFIELGVGFNPELTGRENVFLNGALLGVDRKTMKGMYDDIVSFAELEQFMDAKLKNYSSGMQVRLAFSVAIRVKSDILLLDEVLAVGDAAFQRKCYNYFMELKEKKATVILVTHDMNAIRQYCDRALLIEAGEIVHSGSPEEIAQEYLRLFANQQTGKADGDTEDRWGNGSASGQIKEFSLDDKFLTIKTAFEVKKNIKSFVAGFSIHGPGGVNILEDNTLRHKLKLGAFKPGDKLVYEWQIPNVFASGHYTISVACCDQSATEFYDWFNNANEFDVTKEIDTAGVINPDIRMTSVKAAKDTNA